MRCVLYVTKHSLPQIVTYCGLTYSEHEQLVWLLFDYFIINQYVQWWLSAASLFYNFYSSKDSNIPEILLCKINRTKKKKKKKKKNR